MRPNPRLVLACCSLLLLASPSLADEAKGGAEGPVATIAAPARCGTPMIGTPEPLFMTCTVQVECANGEVKSCSVGGSGGSCSTGGINNRCVICNGVQGDCCPETCCEMCQNNQDNCIDNCTFPAECRACHYGYNSCIAGCIGGCP